MNILVIKDHLQLNTNPYIDHASNTWQTLTDLAIAEIENLALNQNLDSIVEIIQQLDVGAEGVENDEDSNKSDVSLDFWQ